MHFRIINLSIDKFQQEIHEKSKICHRDAADNTMHTPALVSRIMKVNGQDKFQCRRPTWGLVMRYLLVDKFSDGPFLRKKTFIKFEQWGMGLGMFWGSRRLRLLNLSLIYEIMKICEKKIKQFKYWKSPCSYHIVPILAEISSEPSTPSGLLFWVYHYL